MNQTELDAAVAQARALHGKAAEFISHVSQIATHKHGLYLTRTGKGETSIMFTFLHRGLIIGADVFFGQSTAVVRASLADDIEPLMILKLDAAGDLTFPSNAIRNSADAADQFLYEIFEVMKQRGSRVS